MADFRTELVRSMARTLFVDGWAQFIERDRSDHDEEDDWWEGMPEFDVSRIYPGCDLMDEAPETPEAAYVLAEELLRLIEDMNRRHGPSPVYAAFVNTAGPGDTPDLFGHYLVMETLGHGVGWYDDHESHGLSLPRRSVDCVPERGGGWSIDVA